MSYGPKAYNPGAPEGKWERCGGHPHTEPKDSSHPPNSVCLCPPDESWIHWPWICYIFIFKERSIYHLLGQWALDLSYLHSEAVNFFNFWLVSSLETGTSSSLMSVLPRCGDGNHSFPPLFVTIFLCTRHTSTLSPSTIPRHKDEHMIQAGIIIKPQAPGHSDWSKGGLTIYISQSENFLGNNFLNWGSQPRAAGSHVSAAFKLNWEKSNLTQGKTGMKDRKRGLMCWLP